MKRILVLFFIITVIVGSVWFWMSIRPKPGIMLRIALQHLVNTETTPLQASVQWEYADETERNFRFGGWTSFAGALDVRDLSSIKANGILGYSSTPNQADVETSNIVMSKNAILFQEKSFKQDREDWLNGIAGSSTKKGSWYSVQREVFFNKTGYAHANTAASGADLSKVLKQVDLYSMFTFVSSSEQVYIGREYMGLHLKVKQEAFLSVLLTLASAWKHEKLSDAEIVWIKRVANNAAHGDWFVMIDERFGDIVSINGSWYSVDDQNRILGKSSLAIAFGVGGAFVNSNVSKQPIDITDAMFPRKKGSLPISGDRRMATSTSDGASTSSTENP